MSTATLFAPVGGKPMELPKPGIHSATLANIVDLGEVTNFDKSGTTRKILFYYLLDEKDSSGQPKSVVESFTLSVNEKANLYKRLQQINGEAPTASTNIMGEVGKNLQLVISVSKNAAGKDRAKITAAVPAAGRNTYTGSGPSQKLIDAYKGVKVSPAPVAGRPVDDSDGLPF
jgi:hypothetical protein